MSKKPPPVKKKVEYTGSRWAGLILLIITVLLSLFFYLRGQTNSLLETLFGSATYRYEK